MGLDWEEDKAPRVKSDRLFGKDLIDVMQDLFGNKEVLSYCKMTAFRYRMRPGQKPSNINKAIWYENKATEIFETTEW